jgi:hypothetical protein
MSAVPNLLRHPETGLPKVCGKSFCKALMLNLLQNVYLQIPRKNMGSADSVFVSN